MANPGYQDWGRYNVPSADNIFSEAPGPQTFWFGPTIDCSPWSWVMLSLANNDAGVFLNITLSWGGYTSAIEDLISETICVGGSTIAVYVTPTRGRTVQVQYQALTGVPTTGVTYIIGGLSHAVNKYDVRQNATILASTNLTMVANSSQTVNMQYWYEGPITLTVSSHLGGPATVALQQYDRFTNAWVECGRYQVVNDSASLPFNISLFPAPARLIIMNGGTAQTVQVNAVVRSAL